MKESSQYLWWTRSIVLLQNFNAQVKMLTKYSKKQSVKLILSSKHSKIKVWEILLLIQLKVHVVSVPVSKVGLSHFNTLLVYIRRSLVVKCHTGQRTYGVTTSSTRRRMFGQTRSEMMMVQKTKEVSLFTLWNQS